MLWAALFLCGQSPHPAGAPEISVLTRLSRTCVAAAQGALPGAFIKLTCALITPRLSPISSSLESCPLHPCSRQSKPSRHRSSDSSICRPGTRSVPQGSCTRGNRINPDSRLRRRPTGKGCTASIIPPLCLQRSGLSSAHSSAAPVTPRSTSFAPQRTQQILA